MGTSDYIEVLAKVLQACGDQTERKNQALESCPRCLSSRNPASWSKWIRWAEYAHNTVKVCLWIKASPVHSVGEDGSLWSPMPSATVVVVSGDRPAFSSSTPQHNMPLGPTVDKFQGQSIALGGRAGSPPESCPSMQPEAVRLRLPSTWRVHPTFHVSRGESPCACFPAACCSLHPRWFPDYITKPVGYLSVWLWEAVCG